MHTFMLCFYSFCAGGIATASVVGWLASRSVRKHAPRIEAFEFWKEQFHVAMREFHDALLKGDGEAAEKAAKRCELLHRRAMNT